MSKKIELNIKAFIDERWVNDFCSMLKHMELCGNIGHSSVVAFYADGDGNFRPKIITSVEGGFTDIDRHLPSILYLMRESGLCNIRLDKSCMNQNPHF